MNFCAVILAGGQSSRMGRDKAFLEIGGRALLDRQIQIIQETGVTDVFISGRTGVDYSAFDCRVLTDEFPGAGPLAGIHAALKVSRRPLLLVLAVDLPEMNAMFLRSLLMAAAPDRGIVPRVNGRVEPLAAVYPHAALPIIERLMAHGDYAVQSFAAACTQAGLVAYAEINDECARLFKNLNSADDLETISLPS